MRMVRDVVTDKRSDKVVAVVIARLYSEFEISPGTRKGAAQRLGL